MSKLAISALVVVTAAVAVQGSLFGPFGPLGPFGQPAAPPAFGPPGFVQPGAFFPGFPGFPGYQPAVPAYQPSFGPPGYPAGFVPLSAPLSNARALFPVAPVASATPAPFRPKPSPVLERLLVRVLPEDLQDQLAQLLTTYDQGNAECDKQNSGFGPSVGAYRRCVVFNKIAVEQAASALEREADVRAAAEAQAAAEQAAAEKVAAEQAAAEQAAAEQAAADEAEQAAVVEESANEEAAVAEEVDVVAEAAESADDAEEPTVEVEETAEVVVEDVAVEEDSTVA